MAMRFLIFTLFCSLVCGFAPVSFADAFKSTPYPVPRFVSLAKNEAYVRTGPGRKFPIKYVYHKKGMPLEIILEYETWRKIRDKKGEIGWVHQSLLSGKRTGIIKAEHEHDKVMLYHKPEVKAQNLALLEQGVLIRLKSCIKGWCNVDARGYKGWVKRKNIWGVYDSENFN
jgi:SH3-like domain-containing protein